MGMEVVNVYESNLTVTFQMVLSGDNFGEVPIEVLALSYKQFEDRNVSSLRDVGGARSLPTQSSLPCKYFCACLIFSTMHSNCIL